MASTLCVTLLACRPARETYASGRGASAATVDRHSAAYNRRAVNGLLANFDDSSAVFLFGDPDVLRTWTAMRSTLAPVFQAYPHVRAKPSRRIIVGPFVVNQEQVTGTANVQPTTAASAYEEHIPGLPDGGAADRPAVGVNDHIVADWNGQKGNARGLGADQMATPSKSPNDHEILYASPP